MIRVIGVLATMVASSALAETCHRLLLQENLDSNLFHLPGDYAKSAIGAVEYVVHTSCGVEFNLEVHREVCRRIDSRDEHSMVCLVEANVGYFFVTKDMMDNWNVVFNRWD